MSRAASLPGAELVLKNPTFVGRSHLSQAASLPGAELFPDNRLFLKKPLAPGSFAAWGRTFSQKTDFQEFRDSCAQNKTSDVSKMDFEEFWDSCAQNNTSEISNIALSIFLGLLCAEQHARNLNKCTFRNYETPVRGTKRRKSKANCTFRNPVTPVRRTKRKKSQQMHFFYEFWDSRLQNNTSEI